MRFISACLVSVFLAGCAGVVKYQPPMGSAAIANTKEVARSRDEVWAELVPALGKQFFVINNLDKSSGLVNLSYSGDPEKYVNCGWITSHVKNARGERTYGFAGSKARMQYEMFTPQMMLLQLDRSMDLDGRVNLVLEEVGPGKTRVTANTRYVIKRNMTVRDVNGRTANLSDQAGFNGGQIGRFTRNADGDGLDCVATGALEAELLGLVR